MDKGELFVKKPMTLDEAADLYDKRNTGRAARTYPIEAVIVWLQTQKDVRYDPDSDEFFYEGKDDG